MNTKVKVGIAAAIVAALVALIVLDQKTTPKEDTAKPGSGSDAATIVGTNGSADAPAQRISREEDSNNLYERANKVFNPPTQKPAAGTGIKGPAEEKNEKRIPSSTG